MESIKDKVAIVGVGYTLRGRVSGRSAMSFHVEAARNDIEDAGLKIEDVDGILFQPSPGDSSVAPWGIAQRLGIRVRFRSLQDAMGATAGCTVFPANRYFPTLSKVSPTHWRVLRPEKESATYSFAAKGLCFSKVHGLRRNS